MQSLSASLYPRPLADFIKKAKTLGAFQVILYGSRARGDQAPQSDYNIAIDGPGLAEDAWLEIHDLARAVILSGPVDCVWLQDVTDSRRENILRDGKILTLP